LRLAALEVVMMFMSATADWDGGRNSVQMGKWYGVEPLELRYQKNFWVM
jgi:hypothetical protein